MKIAKYFLILTLLLLVALIVFIATHPNKFSITKEIEIEDSKTNIVHLIEDFSTWENWNPRLENSVSIKYINPTKKDIGELNYELGSYKNIGTQEKDSVLFTEIYNNKNYKNTFYIDSISNNTTKLIWKLEGELTFEQKAHKILHGNLDAIHGNFLDIALNNIKTFISDKLNSYAIEVDGLERNDIIHYISIKDSCEVAQFEKNAKKLQQSLITFTQANEIITKGEKFIIYDNWNEKNNTVTFKVCLSIDKPTYIITDPKIKIGTINSKLNLKTTLKGSYSHRKEAWEKAFNYLEKNQILIDSSGVFREVRIPKTNSSAESTELYIAVKDKTVNVEPTATYSTSENNITVNTNTTNSNRQNTVAKPIEVIKTVNTPKPIETVKAVVPNTNKTVKDSIN